MHAPDEPPHYQLFKTLSDADDEVSFRKRTVRRLPPPYDTLCHDYQTAPLNGSQSQKDCFARCLFRFWTNESAGSFNYLLTDEQGFFFGPDLFWSSAEMTDIWLDRKGILKGAVVMSETPCFWRCPADCDYLWFDWNVEAFRKPRDTEEGNQLVLSHQFDADMRYSHEPAVDLFEYRIFTCIMRALS